MPTKWDPKLPSTLCICCKPDKDGNPIPDPNCDICGGEGAVNTIDGQLAEEVNEIYERRGLRSK